MIVIFWAEQFSVVRSPSCKSKMLLSGLVRHLCWVHSTTMRSKNVSRHCQGPTVGSGKILTRDRESDKLYHCVICFQMENCLCMHFVCVCASVCVRYTQGMLPCKFFATRLWRLWLCSQHSALQWSVGRTGGLRAQPQECAQDFSELWPMVKIPR